MLHAGIGFSHVSSFLMALNIPVVTSATQKKREQEIGDILEKAAN